MERHKIFSLLRSLLLFECKFSQPRFTSRSCRFFSTNSPTLSYDYEYNYPPDYNKNPPSKQERSFYDRARIEVCGGHGGRGCASFEALPNRSSKGPPDGANGGDGGDIIIRTTTAQNTLQLAKFHFTAEAGAPGSSRHSTGRNGKDEVIDIPVGTVIWKVKGKNSETGELIKELIKDMDQPNMELIIAKGGIGGRGNRSFRNTDYRRFSRVAENGMPGENINLLLELKVIADVGLVGYPNAGKSSFLAAVSRASPKIAPYPFTTLHPNIGVVERPNVTFSIADLPGLVEGAHKNVGLGHEFLRHIERARVLVYVLDIAGLEGRDPISDFLSLQTELKLYDPKLLKRMALIYGNKTDKFHERCLANLERLKGETHLPIYLGSALVKDNLDTVLDAIGDIVAKERITRPTIDPTRSSDDEIIIEAKTKIIEPKWRKKRRDEEENNRRPRVKKVRMNKKRTRVYGGEEGGEGIKKPFKQSRKQRREDESETDKNSEGSDKKKERKEKVKKKKSDGSSSGSGRVLTGAKKRSSPESSATATPQ